MRSLNATPATPAAPRGGSGNPRHYWRRHTSHTYHPFFGVCENNRSRPTARGGCALTPRRVLAEWRKMGGKGWQV